MILKIHKSETSQIKLLLIQSNSNIVKTQISNFCLMF